MKLNTHTDAKTGSMGSTMNVLHAEPGIAVRTLPEQWIEIEAGLPAAGLETTGVRMRGRVLTIEAVRPGGGGHDEDAQAGIKRVTTRIVLRERPRGAVTAVRQASGSVQVRVPLQSPSIHDDALRARDGIGGVAADILARSHAVNPADSFSYRIPMSSRNGAGAYRSPE